MAKQGYFAVALDLALPEVGNLMVGSVANAGKDQLTNAGSAGVPQVVFPGCADLIDFAGWQTIPEAYADRPFHAHNRLIASSAPSGDERRALIRDIADRLARAKAPVKFRMPLHGIEEWDREGQVAHDPEALAAMTDEVRKAISSPVELRELDCHINDAAFATEVLSIIDGWVADGTIRMHAA